MSEHRDKILEAVAIAIDPMAKFSRTHPAAPGSIIPTDSASAAAFANAGRVIDALTTGPLFKDEAKRLARSIFSLGPESEPTEAQIIIARMGLRAALGAREA